MEIRSLLQGDRTRLVLGGKGGNRKIHLVCRSSDNTLQPGMYCLAELIAEEERYCIYRCSPIPEIRMRIEVRKRSKPTNDVVTVMLWNGMTVAVPEDQTDIIRPYLEIEDNDTGNMHLVSHHLVKPGSEKFVYALFIGELDG